MPAQHPETRDRDAPRVNVDHLHHNEVPKRRRKLGVSERERPEAEVRCRVGDAAEDELDRLNNLVNEEVGERVVGVLRVRVIG